MKNRFENEYTVAVAALAAARAAAVAACYAANHFPVIENDGYPNWDECFFGETLTAVKAAQKALDEVWVKWNAENKRLNAEREAAKVERKKAKAAAAGMTVEEYDEAKKLNAKIRRYEKEIAELEAEIAAAREAIEYRRRFIAEARGN